MSHREWKYLGAALAGAWFALPAVLQAQQPGTAAPPALLNAPAVGQASPLLPDEIAPQPVASSPPAASNKQQSTSHRRAQPAHMDELEPTGPASRPADFAPLKTAAAPPATKAVATPAVAPEREGVARQGRWTEWENGRALWTCEFRNGHRHGKATRFFLEGEGSLFAESAATGFAAPFEATAMFNDGHLEGTCTIVDGRKHTLCELSLKADELEGECTWYYPSGQRREIAYYHAGRLQGKRLQYSEVGDLVKEDDYLGGRVTTTEITNYPSKRKQMRGSYYLAGALKYARFDWLRGDLVTTVVRDYPVDVRTGVWVWWHDNGQRQLEGRYDEDRPVGTFIWWHPNGQKEQQGDYLDGLQSGQWTWWFPNGQKQIQGTYAAGEVSGSWIFWREDGTQVRGDSSQIARPANSIPGRPRFTRQQPQNAQLR